MSKKNNRAKLLYKRRQAKATVSNRNEWHFLCNALTETFCNLDIDENLINAFKNYSLNFKAELVYYKCLHARKYKWAENIKKKYNLKANADDRITALGQALLYVKENK